MNQFIKRFLWGLAVLLVFIFGISWFAPKSNHVEYGVTFSAPYAEGLGLDWKKVYVEMLDDLKPKYVRLSAYWNSNEPVMGEYEFLKNDNAALNFQINEASKRGVKIVLAVGRRLPRWPECHDPDWIHNLSPEVLKNEQLSYIETVINFYQNNQNIIAWQVENEPFLGTFGICPPLDESFFDSELALVKKLDIGRPIIVTDSGELSMWFKSGSRGDIFGTTFYRYVFSDVFKRYWTNYIPAVYYRFKAGVLTLLNFSKPVVIMELQAEPWTTKGIPNTPIEEQFKTMSLDKFNTITGIAHSTGFTPQYLWGVEWWYWMKQKDHPEFWQAAKELFAK
jgi:hypothetical protein